jgi:hypothetical protein
MNCSRKEVDLTMQRPHRCRAGLFVLLPALAVLAPAATRAADKSTDLEGFGKAKFGMSEVQVKKLYPKVQEVPMPTSAPGQGLPFSLTNYTLANQSFGPLRKCAVTLHFYEHGLTSVEYHCQEPKDKILDYLQKRFGPPTQISARKAMSWTTEKFALTAMAQAATFKVSDLARSKQMSYSLLAYVLSKTQQAQQSPGVQPAPTATAPPEAGK